MQIFHPDRSSKVAALFRLQYRAFLVEARRVGWKGFPPLSESIATFRKKLRHSIGLSDHGRPVGLLCFEERARDIRVSTLVSEPRYFRRGIGSALMRHLLAGAGVRPVSVLTLVRNHPAIRLYRKLGFRRVRSVRGLPRGCLLLAAAVAADAAHLHAARKETRGPDR